MSQNERTSSDGSIDLSDDRVRAVDEAGRRAGAALRSPAPAHGATAIRGRAHRRNVVRVAAATAGVGVLFAAGVMIFDTEDPPGEQQPQTISSTDPDATTKPSVAPPSTAAEVVPTAAPNIDFPNLTTTFVSPRNGFSIKHPDGGSVTPAEQLWGWAERVDDGFDVVEMGPGVVFRGTSIEFPGALGCDADVESIRCGAAIDDRLGRGVSMSGERVDGCGVPRGQQVEITIDGQLGRVAECADHIEATVVHGGRLYLFTLAHDRGDARPVFDAVVAAIDLTPETGVDFLGLTETFVSPTYGYSFGYIRGLTPASERWDPSNQPLDDINLDPRFDAVETGFGAYLEGASTPIPSGVSIDEWVDEYVTPLLAGGCGVPRSQQAEITIDEQSGRVAECATHFEATVVAGGRLYLFNLYRDGRDARAMLNAWVATIDLTPETATDPE